MMISVALVLAMGCGKKETGQPQVQTKASSNPDLRDSTKKTPQPKPKPPPIKPDNVLWEFQTGSYVRSSFPIGSDGTVYVGSGDNKLYAINGKSGVKLWEFETGGVEYSSPAIGADGTVYIGSYDKKLYAIKTDSKGLAKSPWPMRGQNPQHTGRAPAK